MPDSANFPVNPVTGAKGCICRFYSGTDAVIAASDLDNLGWVFVCSETMDREDGLCTGCRESTSCIRAREELARGINRPRSTTSPYGGPVRVDMSSYLRRSAIMPRKPSDEPF